MNVFIVLLHANSAFYWQRINEDGHRIARAYLIMGLMLVVKV